MWLHSLYGHMYFIVTSATTIATTSSTSTHYDIFSQSEYHMHEVIRGQ